MSGSVKVLTEKINNRLTVSRSLICSISQIALPNATEASHQFVVKDTLTAVVIDDLGATIKAAGILQSSGKQYTLKGEGSPSLDELRSGPTVLAGACDHPWTLRLTNGLRFHFANDADMTHLWIVDSTTPDKGRSMVGRSVQMATNNDRDYAIVARFPDAITGKPTLIAAGIAHGGTMAAGEFLTSPAWLKAVQERRPSAQTKNVEVVLSTQIINGEPGTPSIEERQALRLPTSGDIPAAGVFRYRRPGASPAFCASIFLATAISQGGSREPGSGCSTRCT